MKLSKLKETEGVSPQADQANEPASPMGWNKEKAIHDLGWDFFKHIGGQEAKQYFLKMAGKYGLTDRDQVRRAAEFIAYNLTGEPKE
jgi:hypothetical protein